MTEQLHDLRRRLADHRPVVQQAPAAPAHIPASCGTTGRLAGAVVFTHGRWPATDESARLIGVIAFDFSRTNF